MWQLKKNMLNISTHPTSILGKIDFLPNQLHQDLLLI